jgi:hypothetical protein
MNVISRFLRKLSILLGRKRFSGELDEEMAFHRQQAEIEFIATSWRPVVCGSGEVHSGCCFKPASGDGFKVPYCRLHARMTPVMFSEEGMADGRIIRSGQSITL